MRGKVVTMTAYVARAGLCAASLFLWGHPAKAQNAEIPPVPEGLVDSLKTILASRREELVNEEARVRAAVVAHDGKCREVSTQSALASACIAGRDSLRSAATKLRQDKEKFSTAVTELNRLVAEESALSQAIRTAVETMRGLIDDATEAGQQQLNALSEQIKTYLATRKQFRVRQAAAVLAVRG